MSWIVVAVIAVAAMFLNGWLATLEDDLPGGFNNPDGTETPPYVRTAGRAFRWGGGVLGMLTAIGFGVATALGGFPRLAGWALSVMTASLALGLGLGARWLLWVSFALCAALLVAAVWLK